MHTCSRRVFVIFFSQHSWQLLEEGLPCSTVLGSQIVTVEILLSMFLKTISTGGEHITVDNFCQTKIILIRIIFLSTISNAIFFSLDSFLTQLRRIKKLSQAINIHCSITQTISKEESFCNKNCISYFLKVECCRRTGKGHHYYNRRKGWQRVQRDPWLGVRGGGSQRQQGALRQQRRDESRLYSVQRHPGPGLQIPDVWRPGQHLRCPVSWIQVGSLHI